MRIIRTEMYFDIGRSLRPLRYFHPNPGVGVAWVGIDGDEQLSVERLKEELFYDETTLSIQARDLLRIGGVLDAAIRGLTSHQSFFARPWEVRDGGPDHSELVEFVLDQKIVVERSPPQWTTLREALSGSTTVVVGTFIGFGLAADSYPLMLLTVPGGIILVGAAIGISKGLEHGLNKSLERLIRKRLK